jgi:nucleotide-binding universal stress UspA family protein
LRSASWGRAVSSRSTIWRRFRPASRPRAKELSDQGIDTKVEWGASILGGPAQVLEAIAERLQAELIVVGRKGRSQIVAVAVGSVTDRLLHVSERGVLTVPPRKFQ